jgi:hypothetical protein
MKEEARLSWGLGGKKLGFRNYLYEMGQKYRGAYWAAKNRVMPRVGPPCRGCGPGTKRPSGWVGTKHY